jgi:isopropylmalate/isohomocitrate dehydrogenase-like protein
MKIAVIRGDGIGPEVVNEAVKVLEALVPEIEFVEGEAGYGCYKKSGTPVPKETINLCRESDSVLFGAVTTPPAIPGYKSAIITLRKELDLYANVRPVASLPIAQSRKNINLVIVRENTEGLYSGIEKSDGEVAIAQRVISKKASERIAAFAFRLAKKHVTIVHKANVLRETCGLFRKTALDVASRYPHIMADEMLVDAMAMRLVRDPENFEVIVTTNLFGDILSDEASMLVGGLGVAPSGNIGDSYSVFEPVHGSAPDIAGKGLANPIAAILSAGMMLEHLGKWREAERLRSAVNDALAEKILPPDLGGNAKTREMTDSILKKLEAGD